MNKAARNMFGYELSEAIGKNVNILMPDTFKGLLVAVVRLSA